MSKKKKYRRSTDKKETPLNPNVILDKRRIITLFGEINEELSKKMIKELIKLDNISHKTITILINSPGGDCTEGLAIVDAIKMSASPIQTVITGMSASMAGIISVCGDIRMITKNAFWMAHPMAGGTYDYKQHVKDYIGFLERLDKKMSIILKQHTKLTKEDVEKFTNGQLWLDAEDCVRKGVCDEIVNDEYSQKRLPIMFEKNKRKKK